MITFMYFSPTGNAAYIAGQLAKTMESMTEDKVLLLPMEHTDCQALEAVDHMVILFSVHAFGAPRVVLEKLKQLPNGVVKKVSVIAVGCADNWINDAASKEIRTIMSKKRVHFAI